MLLKSSSCHVTIAEIQVFHERIKNLSSWRAGLRWIFLQPDSLIQMSIISNRFFLVFRSRGDKRRECFPPFYNASVLYLFIWKILAFIEHFKYEKDVLQTSYFVLMPDYCTETYKRNEVIFLSYPKHALFLSFFF